MFCVNLAKFLKGGNIIKATTVFLTSLFFFNCAYKPKIISLEKRNVRVGISSLALVEMARSNGNRQRLRQMINTVRNHCSNDFYSHHERESCEDTYYLISFSIPVTTNQAVTMINEYDLGYESWLRPAGAEELLWFGVAHNEEPSENLGAIVALGSRCRMVDERQIDETIFYPAIDRFSNRRVFSLLNAEDSEDDITWGPHTKFLAVQSRAWWENTCQ